MFFFFFFLSFCHDFCVTYSNEIERGREREKKERRRIR